MSKQKTLDRPDRETILKIICDHYDTCKFKGGGCFEPKDKCPLAEKADQILALYPDIEAMRRQIVKEIEIHLGIANEGKLDDWLALKETEEG